MAKKIFCTLGPSSLAPQTIQRISDLKVDMFRLNLSHTPPEQIEEWVKLIRANSTVPICLDTQGAQGRTGYFANGGITLRPGEVVELVSGRSNEGPKSFPLYPPALLPQLIVDDLISIDLGVSLLQVVEAGATPRARVISAGTVESNKGITIVGRTPSLAALTDADYAAVEIGSRLGVECLALSFANHPKDVELLRGLVGSQVQIIAKIESRSGLENLPGIIEAADGILIDRGDLSREVPIETLPFIQKEVIQRCNESNVPVYVATNLLESMVAVPRPTRAEVNDVINTLMDGADGLVLAAETAIGNYPVQCVDMIAALIHQFESRAVPAQVAINAQYPSRQVAPHGGKLIERVIEEFDVHALRDLRSIDVSEQVMMDVRQIATGSFSPLQGFMGHEELESVLETGTLPNGVVWPMPILFHLPPETSDLYEPGETVALTHRGEIHGLFHIEDSFKYKVESLAKKWFGTSARQHPGVATLLKGDGRFLGGKVDLFASSLRSRYPYELTPTQARRIFELLQWQRVIGFHTRNVAHRVHEYLMLTALEEYHGDGLFVHPVVGPKKTGDFSANITLRTYELLIADHHPPGKAVLGAFATYPRYAGPREAVFTALCRKNFGCSHFIVGRDHTGVGDYYAPDASQRYFDELGDIGVQPIFFDEIYYCIQCAGYVADCGHRPGDDHRISGTHAREMLNQGQMLPDWYMREAISRLILEEMANGCEVFEP